MNGYESIFIAPATLSEEDQKALLAKVVSVIEKHNGTIHHTHLWGRRRLAYEVQRHQHGIYMVVYFSGKGELLKELQLFYRYADDVIKFQTVQVNNIDAAYEVFQTLLKQQPVAEKPAVAEKAAPKAEKVEEAKEVAVEVEKTEETKEVEVADGQ